jgi:hypothetical protein
MTQAQEVEQLVRTKGAGACSKQRVYMEAYQPFRLGGDLRRPVATVLDAVGPFDIGKGYEAFIVYSPAGVTRIVDSKTGAFVGEDLKTVREDIAQGNVEEMADQITASKVRSDYAEDVAPAKFWQILRMDVPCAT